MSERPLCKCHGEPMQPNGYRKWRCVVRLREQQRRYREANHEKKRENDRRYREANREKIRESKRRYHEANREKIRESKRRYREANHEKVRESERRYEQSRIRVGVGGLRFTYRVRPERREELGEQLAAFRETQKADYRREADGWNK